MSRTGKASLLVVFITVFIDLLGFGIVLPLLPRYARHFHADGFTLGMLMASFSAMQFVFAPIWGRISDRVGRRPILILGLAGSTVFYALFGVATNLGNEGTMLGYGVLPWLFLTRIGAGIAGATIPTAQAYIADSTGTKDRAKGMALIGAAFGIGFTFGPLLGAAFVSDNPDAPPSAAAGYVASVLSGLALLSAIFLLPESLKADATPRGHHWFDTGTFTRALTRPAVGMILLTMFMTTFAFAQFESTLSLLTGGMGLADRDNFFVFAYIGLILTLSQGLIVRRLVPVVGEYKMAIAGVVLMVAGLLAIGLAGQFQIRGMLYATLPIAVMGFSALNPSLQSLLSLRSSESEQGGILGIGQSMAALARIFGPLVGNILFEIQGEYPYWGGAALMGVSLLFVLTLRDRSPEGKSSGAVEERVDSSAS